MVAVLVLVLAVAQAAVVRRDPLAPPTPMRLTGTADVIDGDTIVIAGEHIRLWGIDAPEHAQTCALASGAMRRAGERATQSLAALIGDAPVTCARLGQDSYGRTVARCTVGAVEIGARMVADGWAWDYTRYSDGAYTGKEEAARGHGAGVWAWRCTAPWVWRAEARGV